MKPGRKIPGAIIVAWACWLAGVVGATVLMVGYSSTPGDGGPAPETWPANSQITFDSKRPTLIMFVHPHCPCSRASLAELQRLLAQVPDQLSAEVVFLKPPDTVSDWLKTDLWNTASRIPGVTIFTDRNGAEARRFQAETSGQTLLYARSGALLFQGGITFARGHEGDNPGRTALRDLIREGHSETAKTPVFGCALFEVQCQKGDVLCKP
jgi:hypothetical protein